MLCHTGHSNFIALVALYFQFSSGLISTLSFLIELLKTLQWYHNITNVNDQTFNISLRVPLKSAWWGESRMWLHTACELLYLLPCPVTISKIIMLLFCFLLTNYSWFWLHFFTLRWIKIYRIIIIAISDWLIYILN